MRCVLNAIGSLPHAEERPWARLEAPTVSMQRPVPDPHQFPHTLLRRVDQNGEVTVTSVSLVPPALRCWRCRSASSCCSRRSADTWRAASPACHRIGVARGRLSNLWSAMRSSELLRRLRRLGAQVVVERGKGGHVMVLLGGRKTFVPTGSGELRRGTLRTIFRDLGITEDDLR
jgi:predicted RNA binding protein YcfA (HicA-like mRNA interferase family)